MRPVGLCACVSTRLPYVLEYSSGANADWGLGRAPQGCVGVSPCKRRDSLKCVLLQLIRCWYRIDMFSSGQRQGEQQGD